MKLDGRKSHVKGRSVYKERLKCIELSRAWSFYLSSSSSLLGAIRPSGLLRTSTSNIYLNLSLNSQRPTSLVICIILIHSYRPDMLHDSRHTSAEVFASDQVRSRPMYFVRPGGYLVYYQRGFCHFHQVLWLSWRRSWRLHKGKVLAASSRAFIHIATKGCSRAVHYTPRQVGDLQEGQLPKSYVPL